MLAIALFLRLIDLGTTPANLTADELDDLQNAYRVLEGKAGGLFGLDWNQAPNFNVYLKALNAEVFGLSVAGSRMYGVVLSMATLGVFYPLARRRLDVFPSLLALLLLATGLWFLHFSRTPWTSMSTALAAVLTAYLLDLALARRNNLWLFALLGVAVAFGAYGYFAGRTLVAVVAVCAVIALIQQRRDPWPLLRGFALSGVVAFVLFAPQLKTLLENWDYANTRPRAVSVFSIEGEYLGDSSKAEIVFHQTLRAIRGFVLLDKDVSHYGLWARYHPPGWAFLDQVSGLLYWAGLAAGALQVRRYAYWFVFLLAPVFLTQVFSVGTPDGSRGLMVAPFMYLFVGLGVQTILGLGLARRLHRAVPFAFAAVVVALTAAFNVGRYFDWIGSQGALEARKPAITVEEFPYWRELALEYSTDGRLVSEAAWLQYRQTRIGPGPPP